MEDPKNEVNPYAAPLNVQCAKSDRSRGPLWRTATAGAIWSLISVLPITFLLALFFRFPVPFGDIDGGPSHVLPSMFALLVYGVFMGGFIVVGVFGLVAGVAAYFLTRIPHRRRMLQRCLSIAVAFVLLFVLATLDWYIGPW